MDSGRAGVDAGRTFGRSVRWLRRLLRVTYSTFSLPAAAILLFCSSAAGGGG